MTIDFPKMTMRELKRYVLEHREDQEAFEAFMDRINAQTPHQLYSAADVERFSELWQQYQQSQ